MLLCNRRRTSGEIKQEGSEMWNQSTSQTANHQWRVRLTRSGRGIPPENASGSQMGRRKRRRTMVLGTENADTRLVRLPRGHNYANHLDLWDKFSAPAWVFYGDTIKPLKYAGNSTDAMTTRISWSVSQCDWLALLINNPYLGLVIESIVMLFCLSV